MNWGWGYPQETVSLCHWMYLIRRNNNILRRGGGSEQFLRFKAFYKVKGVGRAPRSLDVSYHKEHEYEYYNEYMWIRPGPCSML